MLGNSQSHPNEEPTATAGVYDAVVIGAGFGGLYMLHRLRDTLGMRVLVLEEQGGVGGTWFMNRYPGARCDTESSVYSYGFPDDRIDEWRWSGKYPEQEELLRYFNFVADRLDLRRSIEFGTRVSGARFDETDSMWNVTKASGEPVRARFLIAAVGMLASAPYAPSIPGFDDFAGTVVHTGAWPADGVDLADKRIGILGTGSTGVQAVPQLAKQAEHLYVLQRTPQFTIPARHVEYDDATWDKVKQQRPALFEKARWSLGGFPWEHNGRSVLNVSGEEREAALEEMWDKGGFEFLWGSYKDILTNPEANKLVTDFVKEKIRSRVNDPATAESLVPNDHPLGSRRPIVDTDYMETFNRDNVTLLDLRRDALLGITESGIRLESGELPLDVLILATGFDAVTGPYLRMDIRGCNGQRLADKWEDVGARSHLGFATSGFPNFFMVAGPGSMFINYAILMEQHVEWISNLITRVRDTGAKVVEVHEEAEIRWANHINEQVEKTIIPLGGNSWWNGTNIPGRERRTLFYFGSYRQYREICDAEAAGGYQNYAIS
ncbi:flavin-containing monooxygenase [Streptomyces sp. NPDC060209]|uniref:flavin-containing monooxygenase n=1 Tax=Streptomyces sp. NPDC060209 TaxID=3347073 RepID=UPI003650B55C